MPRKRKNNYTEQDVRDWIAHVNSFHPRLALLAMSFNTWLAFKKLNEKKHDQK